MSYLRLSNGFPSYLKSKPLSLAYKALNIRCLCSPASSHIHPVVHSRRLRTGSLNGLGTGRKPWLIVFASFSGVNTPTTDSYKWPKCQLLHKIPENVTAVTHQLVRGSPSLWYKPSSQSTCHSCLHFISSTILFKSPLQASDAISLCPKCVSIWSWYKTRIVLVIQVSPELKELLAEVFLEYLVRLQFSCSLKHKLIVILSWRLEAIWCLLNVYIYLPFASQEYDCRVLVCHVHCCISSVRSNACLTHEMLHLKNKSMNKITFPAQLISTCVYGVCNNQRVKFLKHNLLYFFCSAILHSLIP